MALPVLDRDRSDIGHRDLCCGSFGRLVAVAAALHAQESLVRVQCTVGGSHQLSVLGSSIGSLRVVIYGAFLILLTVLCSD